MLETRIQTELSPELALARLRAELRQGPQPQEPGAAPVYGRVEGQCFSARRAASTRGRLHGELKGRVEAREGGATVHARAMGGDWAAMLAGAALAAAIFLTFLLRRSTDSTEQFVLIVLGACSLGLAGHALGSAYADWRFLIRHVRKLFRETSP